MVIYADLIFLINAIFNFLLFSAYKYIAGLKTNTIRLVSVSAAGGVYAVFESVYSISGYIRPFALAVMCLMIWGRSDMVKNTVNTIFIVICVEGLTILIMSCTGADASMTSGTVMVFMSKIKTAAAVAAAYFIYVAVKIYLKRSNAYKRVELVINGYRLNVRVLSDSGNLLKYKNKTVMILRYDAISEIAPTEDYNSFFNHSEEYISYRTIDGGGIIPVFEPEQCCIDGSRYDIAVGVVRNGFGRRYQGIIGSL